ncbi:nucleotidyltransferase/DNA polymerase involved in DNA repair [Candidatus Nitrososphaera evergladensis SR1]|uniref:DNA polymerase IV n=1 Tax=Candidatus Nitrososphaera evergladensis SR1 TaxID=1459636 RepID=A0A075MRF7_9ARCH|nr:nucleotidyltransferase/DNA polymerase involved in DNA repair [Candidatus Nitrososphaera evergladensis SR1]
MQACQYRPLPASLQRVVMHVDFDYFFAQCEEIRRPEIKERPVLVCVFSGRTEDSGVVSTANYVARKYGVKSGIPIRVAKAKLAQVDNALFLPLDADYYRQVSESAMAVIKEHADVFEHVGIDECFIDVSQRVKGSFDAAGALARTIKQQVQERIGLTCSVGVAPNKMLAKVASDYNKPDGLTAVGPENAVQFISALDVDKIPGIGPKTRDRLAELGVKTAGDLASFDLFKLMQEFGKKTATYIHNAAKGIDDEPVTESADGDRKQQIMRIVTLKKDAQSAEEMYADLEEICKQVYESATEKKAAFGSVGIILILDDLENVTRSRALKAHASSLDLLRATARSLLDEAMGEKKRSVRRLGVRISDLQDSSGQNTLFDYFSTAK